MSGVKIIGGDAGLVAEVNAFAKSIEPLVSRWKYAHRVAYYEHHSEKYGLSRCINLKAVKPLARLLGVSEASVKLRLSLIDSKGIEGALEYGAAQDAKRYRAEFPPFFHVGPLNAWCIGHVYLARVESHPHVLKVGFSRRVRDRLEDIASKHKIGLLVPEKHLKVGTQADEHWWHKNWARFHIEGEWFFDPHLSERALPDFLQKQEAA